MDDIVEIAVKTVRLSFIGLLLAAACTGNSGSTQSQGGESNVPGQPLPPPSSAHPTVPKLTPGTPYPVPTSIDHACGKDVTAAFQAWLGKVPNGTPTNPSVVQFASGGCYQFATGIEVSARRWVRLDGQGSTIKVSTPAKVPIVYAHQGCGIDVVNLTIVGLDPVPGKWDPAYFREHGVAFHGVGDPAERCESGPRSTIAGNTIVNVYGDGVTLSHWPTPSIMEGSFHVLVQGNVINGTGRHGVCVNDAHDAIIRDNTLKTIGHSAVLGEVTGNGWSVSDIKIINNTVYSIGCLTGNGCQGHFFVEFHGSHSVSNITVTDNTVVTGGLHSGFGDGGAPVTGITFTGNVSLEPVQRTVAIIRLIDVHGAYIADNTQPFAGPGYFVGVSGSSDVQVVSNKLPGLPADRLIRKV